jgi:AraC-like DNA-binding protein
LQKLVRYVQGRGLAATLLDVAGLSARDLDDPDARMDFRKLMAAYETAAALTGEVGLGLRVAETTTAEMYGLLGHLGANAPTLGAAFEHFARYMPVWTDAVAFEILPAQSAVRVRNVYRFASHPSERRHEAEQTLGALAVFARDVGDRPVWPVAVRFEHERPQDLSDHQRVFGCPVQFRQPFTEIVFNAGDLTTRIPGADAELSRLLRSHPRAMARPPAPDTLVVRVKRTVDDRLRAGASISTKDIAAAAGASPRTLQRRLAAEGASLRHIADTVRRELAFELINVADAAIADVSYRLGFADPSAFHRAFRRWSGCTPEQFRRGGPGS